MSKKIALKKGDQIIIGIPTTLYKLLGVCAETIRRWIRANKMMVALKRTDMKFSLMLKKLKNNI